MRSFTNSINTSSLSHQIANNLFIFYAIILSFLWMLLNYGGKGSDPYLGAGFRWLLISSPLFILIISDFLLVLVNHKIKSSPEIKFLFVYILMMLFSSIILADLKLFSEVIRWALPLIFIAHFRVKIPLFVINGLFISAIIIVILTYTQETSDYGYLPGQTKVNLHEGLWWRISIWKYSTPPYSAAFAIIVFFANFFLNTNKSRFLYYFLTLYFLLLSGSRTSYVIFLICISICMINRASDLKFNKFYCLLPIAAVTLIFLMQIMSDLIPLLGIENEFFNSAILRNATSSGDSSNLSSRTLIIAEHLRMIANADYGGFFGIGSNVMNSSAWTGNGGTLGGSTDSFVSHLLVRDGFSFIFLILAFSSFFVRAMKNKSMLAYICLLALLLYTIGYGAWLNLTSPVFVLYLGFIYNPISNYPKKQIGKDK